MAATDTDRQTLENVKDEYKYGWSQPEKYAFKSRKGLDHDIVDQISVMKGEPEWMRQLRHEALDVFFVQADPDLGRRSERDRLSGHLLLHQACRVAEQELG